MPCRLPNPPTTSRQAAQLNLFVRQSAIRLIMQYDQIPQRLPYPVDGIISRTHVGEGVHAPAVVTMHAISYVDASQMDRS